MGGSLIFPLLSAPGSPPICSQAIPLHHPPMIPPDAEGEGGHPDKTGPTTAFSCFSDFPAPTCFPQYRLQPASIRLASIHPVLSSGLDQPHEHPLSEHPRGTEHWAGSALGSICLAPSSGLHPGLGFSQERCLWGWFRGKRPPNWSSPQLSTGQMLTGLVQPGCWH